MSKPVATRSSSRLKAQETSRKRGRNDEEKEDGKGENEGSAAEESTTTTTQKSTTTTTSTTSETYSNNEEDAMCCVCMVNELSAKIRSCGHTVTCRDCTEKLMKQGDPCPFCRKAIVGFELGKWSSVTGAAGLCPASLKNLSELASGDGFNEYFHDKFNGNEASYKRWKGVFDVLVIQEGKGGDGPIETRVLRITNSEDLVKLRALAKLCSKEYFDDASLSVVAWRRIMEVLDVEKEVGGVKGEKEDGDAKELEILDACAALGKACLWVGDGDDAERYLNRAKEGYEEHLGRDSEKALDTTHGLIAATPTSMNERIEKLRDLLKRCEKALGEENVVTSDALNSLGSELDENEEYEEAKEVYEKCLAGQTKLLGEDHNDTLGTLNNLGIVYRKLKNFEKALEYYERALKASERLLGKTHPVTLNTVMNIGIVYNTHLNECGKAEEMYQRALNGKIAQLRRDQELRPGGCS